MDGDKRAERLQNYHHNLSPGFVRDPLLAQMRVMGAGDTERLCERRKKQSTERMVKKEGVVMKGENTCILD